MSGVTAAPNEDFQMDDFYVSWDDAQDFVNFVVQQLEENTSVFYVDSSLGRETEDLLRKTLKQRKKERDGE